MCREFIKLCFKSSFFLFGRKDGKTEAETESSLYIGPLSKWSGCSSEQLDVALDSRFSGHLLWHRGKARLRASLRFWQDLNTLICIAFLGKYAK